MNFLSNPNLPESVVKTAAIGEGNKSIIKELEQLGIEVIELKSNKCLGALSCHADMQLFDNGNGNFVIDSLQTELCEIINKWGGKALFVDIPDNATYPQDVLLNAASVGDYLICNTKTICREILDLSSKKIIDVNQGYSKCSTCVVNSEAIITDDVSVYNAAINYIDVLLISKGDIRLEGFNYGFIGGATFKLDKNNLGITGKLKTHTDADIIRSFLKNHSVEVVELSSDVITDIGGVIPLMV